MRLAPGNAAVVLLCVPALVVASPAAVPASADETATLRVTTAQFAGYAYPDSAKIGAPARIVGYSTTCTVAGVNRGVPFVAACDYRFEATALVSLSCTASFVHESTLSFTAAGESLSILYKPTVTEIVAGAGSGNGVSPIFLGKVHFDVVSFCEAFEEPGGNMAGYATAL